MWLDIVLEWCFTVEESLAVCTVENVAVEDSKASKMWRVVENVVAGLGWAMGRSNMLGRFFEGDGRAVGKPAAKFSIKPQRSRPKSRRR